MRNTIPNVLMLLALFFFCSGNITGCFFSIGFMGIIFTHQIIEAIKSKK